MLSLFFVIKFYVKNNVKILIFFRSKCGCPSDKALFTINNRTIRDVNVFLPLFFLKKRVFFKKKTQPQKKCFFLLILLQAGILIVLCYFLASGSNLIFNGS